MLLIFRLSHRLPRDERITTHVGLVARAFGSDGIIYSGMKDKGFEESIQRVVEKWGGNFFVEYVKNPMKKIKEMKKEGYSIVHLTMYGINIDERIKDIRKNKRILIVVGGEAVPKEIFEIADYNIAIGNQPHSEVSALAIFLDRYYEGKELTKDFQGRIKIIPSEKGKIVKRK